MINLETKIKIPFLWGKSTFTKSKWSNINLIVGPNGSGKTLLAEELSNQFENNGYDVTFIHSERFEQGDQTSVLKNSLHDETIRPKIETVLSNMFGKSIKFEEKADGSYVPIVINKARGVEYNLKKGECHGLREILILLIALYSCKTRCLILDEPELHLHPQFQQFFMKEIQKVSMDEPDRVFFIITHSPYFIDLRFSEDLLGVVVCHVNHVPTYIDDLSDRDESLFRKFLPRFNTYHKQFFFSDNQIFVEGYTDQQMLTNLLSCIENKHGAVGTGIIDVGGKDELGVFFKVCTLLGTNGRIITDLDALFCGKLIDEVCEDSRPQCWLDAQLERQKSFYSCIFTKKELLTPITIEKLIHKLESFIIEIGKYVYEIDFSISYDVDLFVEKVKSLYDKYEKPEALDTFKTVVLQGIVGLNEKLKDILSIPLAQTVSLSINLSNMILAAIESARVYILPNGCIEHYYTQSEVKYMPISGKDRLFHLEFEFMINETTVELKKHYKTLVSILNRACSRES